MHGHARSTYDTRSVHGMTYACTRRCVSHTCLCIWACYFQARARHCASVHAYAMRSTHIRDHICLPSVERMRAEPSLLGTRRVGASLGNKAAGYERAGDKTITYGVICFCRCMLELRSRPSAVPEKGGPHRVGPTAAATTVSPTAPSATGGALTNTYLLIA